MEVWGIEPIVLVGMVFSLIVLMMIGGFVAVIPIIRQAARTLPISSASAIVRRRNR